MHYKVSPNLGKGVRTPGATAVVFLAGCMLVASRSFDAAGAKDARRNDASNTEVRVSKPNYLVVQVGGNGASLEEKINLTEHLIDELKSHMDPQRIQPVKEQFWSVNDRQCSGSKPCEVVRVEITQLTGAYQYKVESRLVKAPQGATDDPILKPPRTCQVGQGGSIETSFDLHDVYIRDIAGLVVSHDNASHP